MDYFVSHKVDIFLNIYLKESVCVVLKDLDSLIISTILTDAPDQNQHLLLSPGKKDRVEIFLTPKSIMTNLELREEKSIGLSLLFNVALDKRNFCEFLFFFLLDYKLLKFLFDKNLVLPIFVDDRTELLIFLHFVFFDALVCEFVVIVDHISLLSIVAFFIIIDHFGLVEVTG